MTRPMQWIKQKLSPGATRFLIVSSGRSGSNLLLNLLQAHPQVEQWGEIIGEWQLGQEKVKADILRSGPKEYLRRRFEPSGGGIKAVGMKILYHQFKEPYVQSCGVEALADALDWVLTDHEIKVIHLKRRNRLRTLLSYLVATATQQYVLREGDKPAESIRVTISEDECRDFFGQIGEDEQHYDDLLRGHELLELVYEDMVADMDSRMSQVQDFLGLRRCTLEASLKKQNRRTLPESIENYDDLKSAFEGTEWQSYFED